MGREHTKNAQMTNESNESCSHNNFIPILMTLKAEQRRRQKKIRIRDGTSDWKYTEKGQFFAKSMASKNQQSNSYNL